MYQAQELVSKRILKIVEKKSKIKFEFCEMRERKPATFLYFLCIGKIWLKLSELRVFFCLGKFVEISRIIQFFNFL